MPIVPSRRREVQELIAELGSGSAARRDSAVARLTLLGERAVAPLLASLAAASPLARREALRVVERLRDPRAIPEILALAGSDAPEVATRAVEVSALFPEPRVARALARLVEAAAPAVRRAVTLALARLHGAGLVEATDALLDLLLDEDEDDELRLIALEALSSLEGKSWTRVLDRLRASRSARVAERVVKLARSHAGEPDAAGQALREDVDRAVRGAGGVEATVAARLVGRGLPAAELLLERLRARTDPEHAGRIAVLLRRFDPRIVDAIHRLLPELEGPAVLAVLAGVLGHFQAPGSIPALHRVLERLGQADRRRPAEVALAKARIHLELARLGSRIALYDLREMLAARPAGATELLLDAAARVGDATLLPALAAVAAEDPASREPCAAAIAAIVRREGLRRGSRHARLASRAHQAALDRLWPRPSRGGR
jgi:HEAT repeat protein